MAKKAVMWYQYIVDVDAFQHVYQFENAFSKFLAEHGMEGKVLPTVSGSSPIRIVLIRKKADLLSQTPTVPKSLLPKSIKEQMAQLIPKPDRKQEEKNVKFKKGRFLKTKNYLKKGT